MTNRTAVATSNAAMTRRSWKLGSIAHTYARGARRVQVEPVSRSALVLTARSGHAAYVAPPDGYAIERLVVLDDSVRDDVNALIAQLKPSWAPITNGGLTALIASESRVYVGRRDGRIVGLTVMVPHRHLPGLRYHIEDVVVAQEHR